MSRADHIAPVDPHTLARTTDPETSHQAAGQTAEMSPAHWAMIIDVLDAAGGLGLTAHQIAARCALEHVQINRRLHELDAAGEIVNTGKTRATPSGRQARVWRLTKSFISRESMSP